MGLIKTEKFNTEQNQIAQYAKVLGHPARVAILNHLFERNTCVCGTLVDEIGLAQSTISQHLKELKQMDLIKGKIEGVKVCYCIDADNWKKMKYQLFGFLNQDLNHKTTC